VKLSFTVGRGVKRPQGKRVELSNGTATPGGVVLALRALGNGEEEWWSPITWANAYRMAKSFESAMGIAIDVDFGVKDEKPTADDVAQLAACAFPGNAWHPTPNGARVVFVFPGDCSDGKLVQQASRGAAALVRAAIAGTRYKTDDKTIEDLGRLFFSPRARAKGVQRNADVVELRAEPYAPEELATHAPAPVATPPKPRATTSAPAQTIGDAMDRWNSDNRREYPRHSAECPVCGDGGSFGHLPGDETRWHCFSSDHPSNVGVPGANGYHGDALDLEAHARGVKAVDVLRADGYLAPASQRPERPAPEAPATVTAIDAKRRPLRNNSLLTVTELVRDDRRGCVGGKLEYNAMTGRHEIDRRPIRDEDISRVRCNIERLFSGGVDKNGNEVGMKQAAGDVRSGCEQVALERRYHPVEDYLNSLKWDGVKRLEHAPEDLLGAARTPLNSAIFKRFMVSAIARALNPGCKVDTVLILVGAQGRRKSTFFEELAGAWFVNTAVDIQDKDSLQVLRTAWIYEWAELEMLRRAKDVGAAKAFLSSRIDTYRASYGHYVEDVPRGCVIVGTVNPEEFLTDDTGNRRFWPLRVGHIELERVRELRDQLWAEAAELFHAGAEWWLTDEETLLLEQVHAEHAVADVWDEMIWEWAGKQLVPFSAADVLSQVIDKHKGQWTDGDLKRVTRSLKRGGWKPDPNKPRGGSRLWVK